MIQPIQSMCGAFSVSGKNVIVTGGAQGIGFGVASAFAESGANVAILNRRAEDAASAAAALREKFGGDHIGIRCDVSDRDSVRQAVSAVYEHFPYVHVLVNNAGVSKISPFLEQEDDFSAWKTVLDTDLNGTAYMTYEVAKRMTGDGVEGGRIINLSSVGGHRVERGAPMCAYSTAKAAVDHFTRVMSTELGPRNITVNAIAPGFARTRLADDLSDELRHSIEARIPLGRYGEPLEIGALAVFLASPAASHITGVSIIVDGGFGRCN